MKRIQFYTCPQCGNLLTATGKAEVFCCGRKLSPMPEQPADSHHRLTIGEVEDDLYITFSHSMTKDHYLSFFAYVKYDRVLLVKLYPEQDGEVRIPNLRKGNLYFGCSKDGLFRYRMQEIAEKKQIK